jgi:putative acetyltransferase
MIVEATTEIQYANARVLFEEYAESLGFDLCFQGFVAELAQLKEMYGAPRGCLLLVMGEGGPVACVGVRARSGETCEIKRLYVRPPARGCGLGRALAEEAIRRARAAGYAKMVLDTLESMNAAQALYRSLGFRETAPYCENPIAGAVYMELDLSVRQ